MNIQATNVLAPVSPRTMAETGLSMVMMRDLDSGRIHRTSGWLSWLMRWQLSQ